MFVLDRSGSMMVVNRQDVVNFGTTILSQLVLSPTHSQAGIVFFSSRAILGRALTSTRADAQQSINQYPSPLGGTNINAGLDIAKQQLDAVDGSTYRKIVLLMTDGEQSPWVGGSAGAIAKAAELKSAGIDLFALGFGNVREASLVAMASTPSSQYAFLSRNGLQGITDHVRDNLCPLSGREYSPPSPPPATKNVLPPPPVSIGSGGQEAPSPPSPPRVLPAPPPPLAPPPPMCTKRIAMMIVLDHSGSMRAVTTESVRTFSNNVIAQLNIGPSHSKAGVVSFDNRADLYQALTDDRSAVQQGIARYSRHTSGATNINAGLEMAAQQLQSVDASTYERIIMLLSDGEQSRWYGGSSAAINVAGRIKSGGGKIFAVGFGGVSRSTLQAMASSPSSQYSFLSSNGLDGIITHLSNSLCNLIGSGTTTAVASPPPPPASATLSVRTCPTSVDPHVRTNGNIYYEADGSGDKRNLDGPGNDFEASETNTFTVPVASSSFSLIAGGSDGWCVDKVTYNGNELPLCANTGVAWLDRPCTSDDGYHGAPCMQQITFNLGSGSELCSPPPAASLPAPAAPPPMTPGYEVYYGKWVGGGAGTLAVSSACGGDCMSCCSAHSDCAGIAWHSSQRWQCYRLTSSMVASRGSWGSPITPLAAKTKSPTKWSVFVSTMVPISEPPPPAPTPPPPPADASSSGPGAYSVYYNRWVGGGAGTLAVSSSCGGDCMSCCSAHSDCAGIAWHSSQRWQCYRLTSSMINNRVSYWGSPISPDEARRRVTKWSVFVKPTSSEATDAAADESSANEIDYGRENRKGTVRGMGVLGVGPHGSE